MMRFDSSIDIRHDVQTDGVHGDRYAHNLVYFGNPDSWPVGAPDYNLTPRFDSVSWPIFDEQLDGSDRTITLWRNPEIYHDANRWYSIPAWQYKNVTGKYLFPFLKDLAQLKADQKVDRTPMVIPWGKGWGGDGGSSDNGVIVHTKKNEYFEIQGFRKMNPLIKMMINFGAGKNVALDSHYVCDCLVWRRDGVDPRSAFGPRWRSQGALSPAHLRNLLTDKEELALTAFPIQFGPDGLAVDGGWVENRNVAVHKDSRPDIARTGDDSRLVPAFQGFYLDITDENIIRWVEETNTPSDLVLSKMFYAVNLRGYISDMDRPVERKATMRIIMSGNGPVNINTLGFTNKRVRKDFEACGVTNDFIGRTLGKDILKYGTLRSVDGIPS